jgi:hypothetical protein
MNECLAAVERLAEQLANAGVPARAALRTLRFYRAALDRQTETAWVAFYRSVYARLKELADRPLAFVGSGAAPLLTLVNDDLGVRVIKREDLERITARLVEHVVSEASLSS